MTDWQKMLGADVLTLGMAADEVRRSTLSGVVTYLRVQEVDAASAAALAAPISAAAEVRIYSAPATFDEAVAMLRHLRAVAGTRRVVAFSWADLAERGWTEATPLAELVDAGLQDVAELPADRIENVAGAVSALIAAGALPERVTVSHPADDRIAIIRRAQQAFAAHAALRRFSPLPRMAPADKPTTGYDDVRMVALARLAIPDRSIEVDWTIYGPKLAQVALTFGADHLDGVSPLDDTSLGRRRTTLEDVERNIKAAGFEPREYRPA